MNKKGVELSNLYSIILLLVLVAVLMGIGMTILAKLNASTGVTDSAHRAIGNVISSLGDFASTWFGIIILVIAAGIILTLLIGSFMGMGGQGRK